MELKKSDANAAMVAEKPVRFQGRVYKRINAIIARRFVGNDPRTMGDVVDQPENTQVFVELCDTNANSVTVALLKDVELVGE